MLPTDFERIAADALSRNEFTHARDSRKNTHFNPPRTWPYVVLCAVIVALAVLGAAELIGKG